MKPRLSTQREAAMTLFEVGVVMAILIILAALFLPSLGKVKHRSSRIYCTNNLKQIGLACRIWEGDNSDMLPMAISVANGGSLEMVRTGNVVQTFQVMSNELSTPKILICNGDGYGPGDTARSFATNFSALSNSNISYFVGVDVTNEINSNLILSGDGDFRVGGKRVKSGLLSLWTNDPVEWGSTFHVRSGNIGFADGSVQSTTTPDLRRYLQKTGSATNRLAIP